MKHLFIYAAKLKHTHRPSEKNIMRVVCTFCGLFLAIAIVNCNPIVKRDAEEPSQEDLSPLNEVSILFLLRKAPQKAIFRQICYY